jgi:drug/metabolite transporter (DMT)-like permease
VFAAFLAALLFSISILCAHRTARRIGGTEANFWRLTTAAVFLGLWAFTRGQGLSGEAFPLFLVSGIIGIGIGDTGLFQALPRLGPQLSLLIIQCLTAPCGAFIEWLWLGTALSLGQILCGLIILAGVGLVLAPGEHIRITRRELMTGVSFCLLGALGGGWGAVLSRKAYALSSLADQPIDGGTAAFQRIIGGLLFTGFCLLLAKRQAFALQTHAPPQLVVETAKQKWRTIWFWVLINGLAGQTLGVSCMQWGLETTPTGIVLAIIATTPIIMIPFAFIFEGERPSVRSLVGGGIAVGGVVALLLVRAKA